VGRGAAGDAVRRFPVAGRPVAVLQLAVLATGSVVGACASLGSYRVAGQLKVYEILVTGRDSVSARVADAFGRRGFRVRAAVRGGSRPTLAYVAFWFNEPGEGGGGRPRYYARLADTRTGGILATVVVALDSLGSNLKSRVDSLVTLLTAPLPLTP